jgi:predicted enzyme involved in methoxymalonyl-ACP biosynthesis
MARVSNIPNKSGTDIDSDIDPGNVQLGRLAKDIAAIAAENPNDALSMFRRAVGRVESLHNATAWNRLAQTLAEMGVFEGLYRTRVAVEGNANLTATAMWLNLSLLSKNIQPQIAEGPFYQWAQRMLDDNSDLYRFNPSFLCLYICSLGLTNGGIKLDLEKTDLIISAAENFLKGSEGNIILILPEFMEEEHIPHSDHGAWRTAFVDRLRQNLEDPRVSFLDPMDFWSPTEQIFAPQYWHHGRFPVSPNALHPLASKLATHIAP